MSRTKNALILTASRGSAALLGLIILALAARLLEVPEFASFQQATLCYTLALPVLQLGVGQGIFYLLPREINRARGRVIELIISLMLSGLVYSLFLLLGGRELLAHQFNNPQLESLLGILAPALIFAVPGTQAVATLIASERVVVASIWNLFQHSVIAISTLLPIILIGTAQASLTGYVTALFLTSIPAIYLMIHLSPKSRARPSAHGMRELLVYSIPLGIAGMVGTIGMQIDRILISSFYSPDVFALYSVAAFEIPFIFIITGSITSVILTEMTQHFHQGNGNAALELWKLACQKSALVLFPATLFLMLFSSDIVTLLFSNRYAESATIFRIYLLLIPLRTFLFGGILSSAGENRFILTRTLLWALSNILVSILLIRTIGLYGAAIGTVATQYLFAAPLNFRKLKEVTGSKYRNLMPIKALLKCLLYATIPIPILLGSNWLITDTLLQLATGAALYSIALLTIYSLTNNLPNLRTLHH